MVVLINDITIPYQKHLMTLLFYLIQMLNVMEFVVLCFQFLILMVFIVKLYMFICKFCFG
jgi:hypothetical protein